MTTLAGKEKTIPSKRNGDGDADLSLQPDSKKPRTKTAGEELSLNVPETTVEGQMKLNPHYSEDQARAAAKKEYNRRNSARSRVRNKQMVNQLQEKCAELSKREQDLMRENDILRAQLEFYKQKAEAAQQQQQLQTMLARQQQQQAFPASSTAQLAAALLDRKYF